MKPKLFIIALLAILVASCTLEPLPIPIEEGENVVTISVSIPAETRVAYDDATLKLAWESEDKLLLAGYDAIGNYIDCATFTWNGGNSFSGTPVAGADTYKAYYPADGITLDGSGNVQLSANFWQQIQTENNTTTHLRNKLLLFDEEANPINQTFKLVLKNDIIRFKLNIDDISTDLGTLQTLIWTVITTGGLTRSATLNIHNYTYTSGVELTAFLAFDPSVMNIAANGKVKITLIGDKTYEWSTTSINGKNYEAGKRYKATVSANDTWTEIVPFTFTIRIDQAKTYEIWQKDFPSTSPAQLIIDWGDGSRDTISSGATFPTKAFASHPYTSAGDYTVTIHSDQTDPSQNQIPQITFDGDTDLTSVLTPFPHMGTGKYFEDCFRGCTRLTCVQEGLFRNNTQIQFFTRCFSGCTALASIPADLFKYADHAQGFEKCFENCSTLTSIPAELFMDNTHVQYFDCTFSGCTGITTLPTDLFRYNIEVRSFRKCFYDCVNLKLIPEIFPDPSVSPGFFNGRPMDFTESFYNIGLSSSTQGTAPRLWEFTGSGGWTVTNCFTNANVTNYGAIPNNWKGI